MKLNLKVIFTVLMISLFVVGCAGEAEPAVADVDTVMTAAVGTMVVAFFETQTAMYTPETATPISTATFLPTQTPYPTVTFAPLASPTFIYYTPVFGTITPFVPITTGTPATATVNPSALGFGCNKLAFIRDVTVPAGTVLQKNEDFTKTWKVQNTGTCDWMYQYSLVLLSGESFGASGDKLQKVVTVGDWSEVSLQMTAPKASGTHTSYWRMADANGNMFGSTLVLSFVVAD